MAPRYLPGDMPRLLHVTLDDGSPAVIRVPDDAGRDLKAWLHRLPKDQILELEDGGLVLQKDVIKVVEELKEVEPRSRPREKSRSRRAIAVATTALLCFGPPTYQTALERDWPDKPQTALERDWPDKPPADPPTLREHRREAREPPVLCVTPKSFPGGFPHTTDSATLYAAASAVNRKESENGIAWLAQSIASHALRRAEDKKRADENLLRLAREYRFVPGGRYTPGSQPDAHLEQQLLTMLPDVIRDDPAFGRDLKKALLAALDTKVTEQGPRVTEQGTEN